MVVITVAMGDLVTLVVVVTVVLTVVVELLLVVAVAALVAAAMAMVLVVIGLLLQEVIMIARDMVMVEEAMVPPLLPLPMEAMLDMGLVLVVAMEALCTVVLMVHTDHMVVVPMVRVLMEAVPMVGVLMEVVPMAAALLVATVLVDMVVMGEQEQGQEQGVLVVVVVEVQVVGALAGTIPMGNECKPVWFFLGCNKRTHLHGIS